jgi:hypothetical protein
LNVNKMLKELSELSNKSLMRCKTKESRNIRITFQQPSYPKVLIAITAVQT